ncbi:MAG TPA: hypothetical protein VF079_10705 [Sphingomicrobium sp.]
MRFAWKLLVLLAVLLMPFGMAPATAKTVHHQAAMPMQHCPEPAPSRGGKAGLVECTMACSAALPAADAARDGPLPLVCAPDLTDAVPQLHGLHPETATPPPKRS